MKILYHHRIRSKDGQYVHLEELVHALRGLGHEVLVVGPDAVGHAAFGSDAGLVAWMKKRMPQWLYELAEWAYGAYAYRRLAKAIVAFKPDVMYERYNLFLTAGVRAKQRFGLPMLLEVNAPIYAERKRFDGIALDGLARASERRAWRDADVVLPVTEALAGIVRETVGAGQRIEVIPNGINLDHFTGPFDGAAVRARWNLEGRVVLGFTGFVRDWHGLDRVIDAIAKDGPDHARVLFVIGDGPARAALEAQATALRIAARVVFTGIVPREEIPVYVSTFDIALQPAVVAYASPLKLFEYLALGRAIVAPDQSNIREVLDDGVNALLFDPEDPAGLTGAIERLSADRALRARLAEGARQTIARRGLTWAANAERVTRLFDELRQAGAIVAPAEHKAGAHATVARQDAQPTLAEPVTTDVERQSAA
jgi:glycosyltransferase involved in cell wall biosynthesis